MKLVFFILTGATLAILPASVHAQDCPKLGLSESEAKPFCKEFRELLYAPYDPKSDRDFSTKDRRDLDRILKNDPLWGEVYRSDPKQTLDLIQRIREAGGLQE